LIGLIGGFFLPTLLGLSIALVAGLLMTRIMRLFNLPNVTGYLIGGLIIGPFCANLLTAETINALEIVTSVALGFVAFSIGGEFKLKSIKQIGGKIIFITFGQALMAAGLVMAALFIVWAINPQIISIPTILILSAIATATAPAATLMVVKQYRAHGPVTEALLPVVAFDDAIGLVVFSLLLGIAKVVHTGSEISFYNIVVIPLIEISLSLGIGFSLGALLTIICRYFKSRANRLIWTMVCIFSGVALTQILPMSSLLTCMMIGATFNNLKKDSAPVLERVDIWTPPLFMLFFVISGATLDVTIIPKVGIVGAVYLIARSLGKYTGTYISSQIVGAEKNVKNYLGISLLPQAGVAIGMMQIVSNTPGLEDIAITITTVVLCATLIYELFGPVATQWALKKAGEVDSGEKLPITIALQNLRARFSKRVEITPNECNTEMNSKDYISSSPKDESIKLLNPELGPNQVETDYIDMPHDIHQDDKPQ
jgi:Kef-type K+ transport system membrane component KefB